MSGSALRFDNEGERMKLAMQIGYSGGFEASVAQVQALEKAGLGAGERNGAYSYHWGKVLGE